MMVKVRMIRVRQVRVVRRRRRRRLETPRKKAALKAFQELISAGRLWEARRWSRIISSSNRMTMIMVTRAERPMMKKARITTVGL